MDSGHKKISKYKQTYAETQIVEEGPLDDPSSSVVEVAAAAVTGGHKAVKYGAPHRH